MMKKSSRKAGKQVFAILLVLVVFNTSLMPAPVAASEEENIDSFDVHPANRWTVSNTGYTAAIDDGTLNMSDVGDGSLDSYSINRDMREHDSKLEVRFKVDANATGGGSDQFEVRLEGDSASRAAFKLYLTGLQNGGYANTYLYAGISGNTWVSLQLTGDERVHDNAWYRLTIKFDRLKTQYSMILRFDNNTKVFDHDITDVTTGNLLLSSSTVFGVTIVGLTTTANLLSNIYIDYVKAPFKDREWTQTDTPSDADWLEDRWDMAHVQNSTNDESEWSLTVPHLDSASGVMSFHWSDEGGIDDGDYAQQSFGLYAVDADDGELHSVFLLGMAQFRIDDGGTYWYTMMQITVNGEDEQTNITTHTSWPLNEQPRISFSLSLSDDRSVAALKVRYWIDIDSDVYTDFVSEVDIADCADDPSQEFVLVTDYIADFDHDIEWTAVIEDFGFTERSVFEGIVNAIIEPIGNFLSTLFTAAFRFLAAIFKVVGDLIIAALTTLQTALAAILTTISSTLTSIGVDIGSILTDVGTLATAIAEYVASYASAIASAIWDSVGDALDFITAAIEAIWATLEDSIADIVSWLLLVASDIADLVFAVVEYLITLLLTIAIDLFELLAAIVFAAWDALGLPNLLAWLDYLLAGIVSLSSDGLDAITWVRNVAFVWAEGVFFIGIILFLFLPAIRGRTIGEFAESFIQMNSWNILPVSILGFKVHVPVGVVYWPLLFLYVFEWG